MLHMVVITYVICISSLLDCGIGPLSFSSSQTEHYRKGSFPHVLLQSFFIFPVLMTICQILLYLVCPSHPKKIF